MDGMGQGPMQGQGALEQEGPQAPQQAPPQEQSGELFPKDMEEVTEVSTNLMNMMYENEENTQKMVTAMTQTQTIEEGIVQMVAMILAKTLTSATKSTGRDINNEFVDDLTVMLVTEMYTMLKAYGEISHMPPQNVLKATVEETMIMLGQMLKRQLDVEQQQKEHDEAQGGGQPQGAPQGPPQPQGQPAPAPQGGALGM